ncbi:PH domain-containing protein [Chloroflexota bacterium]
MQYSKSILLYKDKPTYGLLLKLILIIPVAFLLGSLYLYLSGDLSGSLALLIGALLSGLIFWFVFPREYQIYEDHLRIVLGSPFSVKVGFQNIKTIRITNRTGLTINFVTRITRSYVEIVKKKGLTIAITPTDNDPFVENANRALEQWFKTQRETGVT